MSYKKRSGFKRITAVAAVLVLALSLLLGTALVYFKNNADAGTAEEVSDKNKVIQSSKEIQVDQSDNDGNEFKYLTFSQYNNINITVNYLSPKNQEKDFLTFYIALDTHTVELTKYKDIGKYVELQTDAGVAIREGFEWNLESSEVHHISGTLKIKNNIEGKPIVDSDTKSFKLMFKNVGDAGVREHVYEGDKLK